MKRVTAALMIDRNRVLIARRHPAGRHGGWWEFPGGQIEAGETPEACLCREIREELELEIEVGELVARSVYEYDHGEIELLAYRVCRWHGVPVVHVHDRIEWVTYEELLTRRLLPADVPIAQGLGSALSN